MYEQRIRHEKDPCPEIIALTQGKSATNAIKSVAEDKAKFTTIGVHPQESSGAELLQGCFSNRKLYEQIYVLQRVLVSAELACSRRVNL